MTKRFKAVINDMETPYWEVWDADGNLYANFFGPKCCQYARDHARRLNGLKEKEKQ